MLLMFHSLAPRQASLIRNLRLDIDHFLGSYEWEDDFKNTDLKSLRGLQNLQLFLSIYETPDIPTTTPRHEKSRLPDSFEDLSALRPSCALVSKGQGRYFRKTDMGKLAVRSETKDFLERLQGLLVEQVYVGKQSSKQKAVNKKEPKSLVENGD